MEPEIYDNYRERVMKTGQVIKHIRKALQLKQPFTLVRFGHAEAQLIGYILGIKRRKRRDGYYEYCGVKEEDFEEATESLVKAFQEAEMVGAGVRNWHHEFPLIQNILQHYNWKLPDLICKSEINRSIIYRAKFYQLLKKHKVIIVGRRAKEGKKKLKKMGVKVMETYTIDDFKEIDTVMQQIKSGKNFDIALIAAGINAVILATKIQKEMGEVAIDIGHGLDMIIDGESFDYYSLEKKYWEKISSK